MNQGTPEWLIARAGHVTASRFADVLAKVKVGESKERQKYRWELAAERLTGVAIEGYKNRAMERGIELEPVARMEYEASTGNLVQEVGFIAVPGIKAGASPDGLIDEDGGCEIKCPDNPVIHIQTVKGGMPTEHRPQVQGGMWVTGRKWWDFISYDPRMPEGLRLYVERIKRDETYIAALEAEVRAFDGEVSRLVSELVAMKVAA